MSKLDKEIINNIKMLGIDMINIAGSGHPGVVLSLTPLLYTLYKNHLNIRPKEPSWINRDRLVLSNGHASAALYATLHVAGFDIGIDDLKDFRRINSITPGHPETKVTPGVDVSTGPLGQGIANAVGMALAERYLNSLVKKVDSKNKLIDYYTYCICSDGDLMEGISYEALSFASKQNLNKLIIIYESNKISLDGNIDNTFTENIEDRFLSLDIDVINVKNGNNLNSIDDAINEAKSNKRPTLIILNTILGKDSLLENTNKVHGKPLTENDIVNLRNKYKITSSFEVKDEYYEKMQQDIKKRMAKVNEKWNACYEKSCQVSKLNGIITSLKTGNLNFDFNSENYKMSDSYSEGIREGNNKIFNLFANKSDFILCGSADVSSSTKLLINKEGLMSDRNPLNRNIAFGVREHAMAAIANGISLSNIKVFISTYLAFADYLKPAMRMSALMNLPVTYVFTHDSVKIGYDGPTHEPIEQLSSLRLIPNLITIRPADINEVLGTYEYISKHNRPVCIILGNEEQKKLPNTNPKYVSVGAYPVKMEKENLNAIFIATGSEVSLALKIANDLKIYGLDIRVVSMPSVELFLSQNSKYEMQLLPKSIKTFVFEFGNELIWNRFTIGPEYIFGINQFGKSGRPNEVLNEFNLDEDAIKSKIIELMKNKN